MKRLAYLSFVAICLPSLASQASQPVAMLEGAIKPNAAVGDQIALRSAECRYNGRLVREPASTKGFAMTLAEAAGADTGHWYIDILSRTCGQQVQPVKLRAYLPKPPSLAGGGGHPHLPYGYEAGTEFTLSFVK
jgi:hypothetical protein